MKARAERLLEPRELKFLSIRKLYMKAAIILILIILVGAYLYATIVENIEVYREIAWFSCDPEVKRSIVHELSVKHPVTFCRFRYSMALISLILLFPFLLEALTLSYLIYPLLTNGGATTGKQVGLVEGRLVLDKEYYLRNQVFALPLWWILLVSTCFFWFMNIFLIILIAYLFLVIVIGVPLTCFIGLSQRCISAFSKNRTPINLPNLSVRSTKSDQHRVKVWTLLILPEIILAYLLLPTSFLIVLNSQTPEDVIVNIVAVQIFSQLDEIIVRILLNPEVSLGMSLSSLVRDDPDVVPIPVYELSDQSPQMVTDEVLDDLSL